MAEEKKRLIRKALNRMSAEDIENVFWYMTVEGLI
jgi:hypothetical protein